MSRVLVYVLALALISCSANRRAKRLEGRFDLGDPGSGWARVDSGGADQAWFHTGIAGSIYADSNCAERFEDGPLEDLLVHLTAGIARGEHLEEQRMTLDGRDAVMRTWNGALDGIAVQVGAAVTRKHECVYDVVYIAPPARFAEGWPAFEAVVGGFQTDRD